MKSPNSPEKFWTAVKTNEKTNEKHWGARPGLASPFFH